MKAAVKIAILMVMAAASLFVATGCKVSHLEGAGTVIEEQSTEVVLNFESQEFSTVTRAVEGESEVNCLVLFVFNEEGKLITRTFFDSTPLESIKLRTSTGRNMRVVAVANYKSISGLEEQLAAVANYDVLNDVVVTKSAMSFDGQMGILMTGETVADIYQLQGGASISVKLQYAVAKITLFIKVPGAALSDNESLEIFNLALGSITGNGFLMPSQREPEGRLFESFEKVELSGNQEEGMKATFYMLQNMRGGRVAIEPPVGIVEQSGNGHLFKRHYAPLNSSYAVVSANLREDGVIKKRVDMYVYFGQNNSNDYNVSRSENHTYSIRINGVNNVNVDTNVEATDYDFEFGYGDNLNMDSHADSRSLFFGDGGGVVKVEIVDQSGRRVGDAGFDATWLKVSPLDLMKHQVRMPGNGYNTRWQQSGPKNSIVRGKYIPHKSVREKLTSGGWNEIPSGKDDDDRMSYADATFRMCYAISDIQLSEQREIVIYSDENTTQNERFANVEISYTDVDGNTRVQLLPISQVPLYVAGEANGYQMLIESFEENTFNIYADPHKQLTKHSGMHWGFYSRQVYKDGDRGGDFLTANAVYGSGENSWVANNNSYVQLDGQGLPTWSGDIAYRTKYGATNVTSDWSTSYGEALAPYHYPNYDENLNVYAPVYNSSAARYCHEKNRDLNGDGLISPDETTWYLPSISQMRTIWGAMSKLPQAVRPEVNRDAIYWSSSESGADASVAMAFSFVDGSEFSRSKRSELRVRCVRRGEKAKGSNVSVGADGSIIVDNTSMDPNEVTTTPKSKIPASELSDVTVEHKFILAKKDIDGWGKWTTAAGMSDHFLKLQLGDNLWSDQPSGCSAYYENGDFSQRGQWRLPTRKELQRIMSLQGELGSVEGFVPFERASYWSATEKAGPGMYYSWVVSSVDQSEASYGREVSFPARCIRPLPN